MKAAQLFASLAIGVLPLSAEIAQVNVKREAPRPVQSLELDNDGKAREEALSVANGSLLRGGKPWWAITGDFAFGRIPERSWENELVRIKGAGVDLLLVDLSWAVHAPREGSYDWTGVRNLGAFLDLCQDKGLAVILCLGPSGSQGRNPSPGWLEAKGLKLRSDDSAYLREVSHWYEEVSRQAKGRLRKEGGPIIGVQLESDFSGPTQTLLRLKSLAIEAGLELPLYTISAAASLSTPIPAGQLYRLPEAGPGLWKRIETNADARLNFVASGVRAPVNRPELSYRRLALFLKEYGANLGAMSLYDGASGNPDWLLRSSPTAGFLFVHNRAQGSQSLQLGLTLPDNEQEASIPGSPVSVPGGARSIWPINLPLNPKVTLAHATATPLCTVSDEIQQIVFLGTMPGVPADIAIAADLGVKVSSPKLGQPEISGGSYVYHNVSPDHEPVIEVKTQGQLLLRIVVLNEEDSLHLAKINWLGQQRVVIWPGLVLQEGERMDLYDEAGRAAAGRLLVFPSPADLTVGGRNLQGRKDGLFTAYDFGGKR